MKFDRQESKSVLKPSNKSGRICIEFDKRNSSPTSKPLTISEIKAAVHTSEGIIQEMVTPNKVAFVDTKSLIMDIEKPINTTYEINEELKTPTRAKSKNKPKKSTQVSFRLTQISFRKFMILLQKSQDQSIVKNMKKLN